MEQSSRRLVKLILGEVALLFVLVVLVTYLGEFVGVEPFEEALTNLLPPAITVIFILIATLLFVSVLRPVFERALSRFLSSYEAQYTWQFIKYSIWIASLLILAFILAGNTLSLNILIGVFILIFVLISWRALGNFAGWLYIIFHHQLRMGDLVEVNGIKGRIAGITMMNTILAESGDFSDKSRQTSRRIMIPNSYVFSSPIISLSSKESLVWDEIKVMLPSKADHLLAKDIISQVGNNIAGPIMKKHKQEMMNQRSSPGDVPSLPNVVTSIEPEGVLIVLSYYCQLSERSEVRSAISENILSEFNKEGIELAFKESQT
jgi:small-conductance mechanosensitive channel